MDTILPPISTENRITEGDIYRDVADRLGTKGVAAVSLAITRAIQTAADKYMTEEFQAAERGEITFEELAVAITVYLNALPADVLDEGRL